MKKIIHGLIALIGITAMLTVNTVWADDMATISVSSTPESLPLTTNQIKRLQHLFPHSSSQVNGSFLPADTPPPEHIVWQQTPIDVVLPIGKERMVSFPASVQFGYDKNAIPDSNLRIQNNGGVLYLLAKAAFSPQRVEVKLNDSGKIILLNLSAKQEANTTPLDIIIPAPVSGQDLAKPDLENPESVAQLPENSVSTISLTRFAAQQLYAPKRLLTQPSAIYRTPMHTHKTVPLLRDGSVIAMPLASWRGGDLFVTAVLLRNQEQQSVALDPRQLCGDWQAATLFPQTQLAPMGNRDDSTTAFLVSNRPFMDAFRECTQGF